MHNYVKVLLPLLLIAMLPSSQGLIKPQTRSFALQLPNAKPTHKESYLCTPLRLDADNTYYVVGFQPTADQKTAHHMLLYGCKTPGRTDAIFNCGSMAQKEAAFNSALQPCGSGSQVVYAWAKNAPELDLPEGVGFRVGGPNADIDWLVLQVHYASVDYIPPDGDASGVILHYTNIPQPRSAGVYYSATNGRYPAGDTTYSESACTLNTDKEIHPFAFRVHTHGLGRVVSGWKVSPDMTWTLLGKKDPQLPQMFYPVADNTTVLRNGDYMASRCTMVNYRDHAVSVGSTNQDEMCNFYLMYWVEGTEVLSQKSCFSVGPPLYSWGGWILGGGLSNIPDEEASSL